MNVDSSVKAGMSSAPSNLLEGVDIDEGFKLNQKKPSAVSAVRWISISNLSKSGPSEDVTGDSGFDLPNINSFPLNLTREAP